MTRRRRALLLALATLSCGPYADVAQKLDVTARVAGDTWIAAAGDRTELRVLIVGAPGSDGTVRFAFASVQVQHSRGDAVFQLQGRWVEIGSSPPTLHVEHRYSMPDESGESILARGGTTRSDDAYDVPLTVTRDAGRLVVSGNADLAGTYVPLVEALGRLGTAAPQDAACAFQIANVGMLMSQGRIIGFGGVAITQYRDAEDFVGTVAGKVRISASLHGGGLIPDHSTVTLQYSGFQDVGGVRVDGPMITDADSGGNGHMSGVMTFAIMPAAADGTPLTPITGTIDYGTSSGNPVQIADGTATGGVYSIAIDGGSAAVVSPETAPSPSVSECLALP